MNNISLIILRIFEIFIAFFEINVSTWWYFDVGPSAGLGFRFIGVASLYNYNINKFLKLLGFAQVAATFERVGIDKRMWVNFGRVAAGVDVSKCS